MKMMWCWRCKMEVPMLEGEEARHAYELYGKGFQARKGDSLKARFQEIVTYYEQVTGWANQHPNVIIHHLVDLYGPSCEQCGKPYRTKLASFCAACGHKRPVKKRKLSVSFDLDDTLIPGASLPFQTEPITWWQKLAGTELLRAGTVELMKKLQANGHKISIYTSSLRPTGRIRRMLSSYGIRVDQVINRTMHLKQVAKEQQLCSKYPPAFGIDLHIDDSEGVATEAREYGYQVIVVALDQENWTRYVLEQIDQYAAYFE